MDGGVELFAYGRQDFARFLVISRANLRARFLQALLRLGHCGPWSAQFLRRHPCRLGAFETRPQLVGPRGDVVDQGVGRALGLRLGVGGLANGVLRALACVDRVAQGLTVVALLDGVARLLQASHGRGVFLRRELVGAGGPGEIDGCLRLVDLLPGRLGASRRRDEDEDEEHEPGRGPVPKQRERHGLRRKAAHGGQSIAAG